MKIYDTIYSAMRLKFICENDNIRLSEELKLHISKKLYKNIKSNNTIIYVNNEPLLTYKIINKGDIIEFDYENQKEINWPIYESKLDIVYKSDNYLIVNKPKGLLSIPTKAEPKSLYQEVLYYLKNNNMPLNVSILNRLDKDTQGLCVIALNKMAAYYLQPTHEKMERRYLCLVHGILDKKEGRIVNYIDKALDSHKRFISNDNNGKLAISNYRVIKEYDNKSLLEFILETGRTHQIRLHCSNMGHPIVGDKLYGTLDDSDILYLKSYYVKYHDNFLDEDVLIILKGDNFE